MVTVSRDPKKIMSSGFFWPDRYKLITIDIHCLVHGLLLVGLCALGASIGKSKVRMVTVVSDI